MKRFFLSPSACPSLGRSRLYCGRAVISMLVVPLALSGCQPKEGSPPSNTTSQAPAARARGPRRRGPSNRRPRPLKRHRSLSSDPNGARCYRLKI